MRLDQRAVITRTAFRATLELSNNDPALPLTSVSARIEIRDLGGQPVSSRFLIETPTLERIDRVDGAGTLAANTKATIRWMLISADEAAASSATVYNVGGEFSYTLDGNQVRVPLEPVAITVYPDAALDLTYFHQRDVFSDDPFTPELEPAQPYSLVVRIKNSGAGAAKSLKISSGEPQIVSNDKGLLIDFALLDVALEGTNMGNTLSLDFGRIEPGAIKTAEWRFTSSLQGFFRNFSATFQHEDNLGDIRLSTIKSVAIHEMEHIVYASYGFADGKPDYLVNDSADPNSLPDALYLSNGSTQAVQVVQQASLLGTPTTATPVQLSAIMPPGWTYLRVPEPSGGQLRVSRVQRSDGAEIAVGTNAWVTDRTFVGPGQPPVRENILHLLDYNSSGIYTLFYTDITNIVTDSTAPSSAITSLPVQSPDLFAVSWSGQDNPGGSGLTYFDIFVSSNGGPFQVWLPQTTLRGSMFAGTQGSTYAFYSLATDQAGNRELPPGGADAQATVTLVNTAPVLAAIATATIDEGETLALTCSATDADLPANNLTFSLAAGAPSGMTINPNSGGISWATGELQGPTTNVVTVRVTDNGQPSLDDSKTFTVIVREANRPPTLATIPFLVATEGIPFSFLVSASDPDLPANTLAFSLAPGFPTGAAIQSGTGLLTWTPSENQGGATNSFGVIVNDSGGLSTTQSVTIVVNEGNTAPIILPIAQQTIDEETELVVPVSATDSDVPTNRLTFSLTSAAPSGASIDATTGIFRWIPTEAQGPATNAIQIVVTDDGFPNLSSTQSLSVVVHEVNTAPTLLPISNQVAYVLSGLRVTNLVIDPDIPTNRMHFTLADGAPAGARISTNSGIFSWTPTRSYAQSSNLFTVIVTDNGIPPLSATNSFSVVVGDYFELSVGSTVLRAGQSGNVSVIMDSSSGVTNLSFLLATTGERLTNFTLQLIAPEITGAVLEPFGPDSWTASISASGPQPLVGSRLLANLNFTSSSNQNSAFVPLTLSGVTAMQPDGTPMPQTLANNGRVVVVGANSLLEALVQTNGQRTLVLYGKQLTDFTVESTTNLMDGNAWKTEWQSSSTNLFQVFDVSSTNGMIFFRAREGK